MCKVPEGSISHGTLRPQDLLRTFMQTLMDLSIERYQEIWLDEFVANLYVDQFIYDLADDDDWWYGELASYLLCEAEAALESLAPEGMYFGCLEGDGSDFGFWSYEVEELSNDNS